ncbi:DUF5937 family protein [Streptomyces cynarae]|uniref:DUF5937 family protein n=1 Tax=Streptomyces cynarae TaxID=2981134 RepID=A0ABY6DTU0_9ACTN|nr:DUF5937 family protein [Streptomyces cynarae]
MKGQQVTGSPLQDRTVVITGAARGLGAALAYELARRGARPALLGRPSRNGCSRTRPRCGRGCATPRIGAALASVSGAVTLAPGGDCIVVDKVQDKATAARGAGVTFIPSVFGRPHLVAVHAPGWHPVVQYPVAEPSPSEPVSLETVTLRLEALAHPVRLRLLRTLARGPHTTGELAHFWELSPPEVSRHLAVLRRAGLLTARRHGRYVRYTLKLPDVTALGADLLAAVLR